ncbi:beta-Ig-H3/fasciclin [Streptomyces sp. NBC_00111]|uniref:beta-Ig-H3/fasciclin n=1 Tax=unclassified Streptomyces TaxID=2593676 RepID=UPI002E35C934|nr:beta-Ig-H3/fasciclin [Streptomyces sp. NBC_01460]
MRMSRKAVQAAVTAAALGGSMIISVTPAAAATTAPTCIGRMVTQTTDGFDVLLTNRCGGTRSVKVVVSLAPDSSCYVMSKGTNALYVYHGILGNYDRTVNC